jgi:hypothetical protein
LLDKVWLAAIVARLNNRCGDAALWATAARFVGATRGEARRKDS